MIIASRISFVMEIVPVGIFISGMGVPVSQVSTTYAKSLCTKKNEASALNEMAINMWYMSDGTFEESVPKVCFICKLVCGLIVILIIINWQTNLHFFVYVTDFLTLTTWNALDWNCLSETNFILVLKYVSLNSAISAFSFHTHLNHIVIWKEGTETFTCMIFYNWTLSIHYLFLITT